MTRTTRKRSARFLAILHVEILDPEWTADQVGADLPDRLEHALSQAQEDARLTGVPPYEVRNIDTLLSATITQAEEES